MYNNLIRKAVRDIRLNGTSKIEWIECIKTIGATKKTGKEILADLKQALKTGE